jgi:hypothetical protein
MWGVLGLTGVNSLSLVYMAYDGATLFQWHPVGMSVGVGLLMAVGVQAIRATGPGLKGLNRGSRGLMHAILMGASAISMVRHSLPALYEE